MVVYSVSSGAFLEQRRFQLNVVSNSWFLLQHSIRLEHGRILLLAAVLSATGRSSLVSLELDVDAAVLLFLLFEASKKRQESFY
jgi:hypothetical protein